MPRMTICRSSLVALVGLVLWSVVPAGAQGQPETHTVRAGDTLWDLAQHYLGDAFLWPQIYRLNTQVVEDPHWIYPGEVLRLLAGENQPSAVPDNPTPAPEPEAPEPVAEQTGPRRGEAPVHGTPFWEKRAPVAEVTIRSTSNDNYRPLRSGEFYSSGFLTETESLPFGRLLGATTPQQIRNLSERASATVFTTIAVVPPKGGTYAEGDSLLLVLREIAQRGYGEIVLPTGLARVIGKNGDQYLAQVVAVYGPIRNGQYVLPAERFPGSGSARAVAVDDGLTGRVIGGREARELKHPQNVLFIDQGRLAGVAQGDIFEVRREAGPRLGAADTMDELMAVGQVVHVRDRSATLLLLQIVSPDIPPRTLVRQVAKLPS